MSEPIIVATELVKYYREHAFSRHKKLALDNLTLEIGPGQIVALLGCNGAGKTTFLRILFGLIFPTSGEVKVFGQASDDPSWRKRAGYVSEFYTPPKFLRGFELLKISARMNGKTKKEFLDRLEWLDQALGIKPLLSMRISDYSRGNHQQIAIAQALIHDPNLVVLDEPTANLDAVSRKRLKLLLAELRKNGKTILLSSHILSEVEELCDRVIFLEKGKLIQQGKTKDLLSFEGGYLITFKTPGVIPEELGRLGSVTSDAELGTTLMEARTEGEKDLAVRILAQNGISLECLEPKQKTLEDLFLSLMEEKTLEKYFLELVKDQ